MKKCNLFSIVKSKATSASYVRCGSGVIFYVFALIIKNQTPYLKEHNFILENFRANNCDLPPLENILEALI